MARRRRRHGSNALFDSIVKNALDFLELSVSELRKRPKYSLIHFCSALELFLKARLLLEHWSLIVAKPETAHLAKFQRGDFRSVTMEEAIQRLRSVADEQFSREDEICFALVREHRNKLVHFFHEHYVKASRRDTSATQEVVAEQCKAWFYLYRLLTGRWSAHFEAYAGQTKKLNAKMHTNRIFLKAKYTAIAPDIQIEIASGVEYALCFSCGFKSLRIVERETPLYGATCRVCAAKRRFLRVECPECGETIQIDDMGAAECPNEDFSTDIDWLVEKYGPAEDPKEESTLAYCSYCERGDTPTAIPFGDLAYLCLSCLEEHESADNCEWCGTLNATLRDMSYLNGCVVCEGKFGSESFARE